MLIIQAESSPDLISQSFLVGDVWMKAMSMANLISAFKTTGVYPFSRKVVDKVVSEKFSSFKPESLPDKSGLAYIPLYSLARPRTMQETAQLSSAECPGSADCGESSDVDTSVDKISYSQAKRSTAINKFLNPPLLASEQPTKHVKSSGRVLTSAECIKNMEEKEQAKQQKAQQKEQKKKAREEKRKEKAVLASEFIYLDDHMTANVLSLYLDF